MRCFPRLSLLIAAALTFGVTLPTAHADDNPCDPAKGRYICDGSEDQPEGARPKANEKKRQKQDNPCDPANGSYTCDGSEDQPDGDTRPYWKHWKKKPKLPDTGVSAIPQPSEETQIQDPATSLWHGVQAHYPVRSDQLVVWAGDRGYLY